MAFFENIKNLFDVEVLGYISDGQMSSTSENTVENKVLKKYIDRSRRLALQFIINGTYNPDDPKDPEDPEDPDNPYNPDDPDNPYDPDYPDPDNPDVIYSDPVELVSSASYTFEERDFPTGFYKTYINLSGIMGLNYDEKQLYSVMYDDTLYSDRKVIEIGKDLLLGNMKIAYDEGVAAGIDYSDQYTPEQIAEIFADTGEPFIMRIDHNEATTAVTGVEILTKDPATTHTIALSYKVPIQGYEDTTVLDGDYEFIELDAGMYGTVSTDHNNLIFRDGYKYIVTFDNVEYDLSRTYLTDLAMFGLGNLSLSGMGDDTGEPFVLLCSAEQGQILILGSEGSHNVKFVIRKIIY